MCTSTTCGNGVLLVFGVCYSCRRSYLFSPPMELGVGLAVQVFTTLALLNITQFTMGKFLYLAVQTTSESWVSIKRMETILLMEVCAWVADRMIRTCVRCCL